MKRFRTVVLLALVDGARALGAEEAEAEAACAAHAPSGLRGRLRLRPSFLEMHGALEAITFWQRAMLLTGRVET